MGPVDWPFDFSSAEAFPLQTNQVAFTGAFVAAESASGVYLNTAGGRMLMSLWASPSGSALPFLSAPAAKLAKGDLYEATYLYPSPAGSITATAFFRSPAGQTLAIPALPSGANVRNSGGPGEVRLTVEWPRIEPGSIRFAGYGQGPDMSPFKWWQVTVSPSYPVGAVTAPDVRNVAGWNPNWDLAAGVLTNWTVASWSST